VKLFFLIALLGFVSCQPWPHKTVGEQNIIVPDDYVLIEFAAKLEEAENNPIEEN
jgi:hypothetical protein